MTSDDIIAHLKLEPLPNEGGYFREKYRAAMRHGDRAISTAIYYLITPSSYSALHRLPIDEVWHFYLGDPVEQLRLFPDGDGDEVIIGNDLAEGQVPQTTVAAGTWQGSQLVKGGTFALLGTTMAPGFEFSDFELGDRKSLAERYPQHQQHINNLLPS